VRGGQWNLTPPWSISRKRPGPEPGSDERHHHRLTAGWIPLRNAVISVKVDLGFWTMVQLFIDYRGLL
jgi:hypothetical protein